MYHQETVGKVGRFLTLSTVNKLLKVLSYRKGCIGFSRFSLAYITMHRCLGIKALLTESYGSAHK